jgi:HPt (histidine-containing phosphotransfer) domain-containing protein
MNAENGTGGEGIADSGINLQAALETTGGDVKLLGELAEAFFQEVPQLLQRIDTAIQQQLPVALQDAAHQLQGVMRCLHIERALHQARMLEEIGKGTPDWSAAQRMFAALDPIIQSANKALAEFFNANQ